MASAPGYLADTNVLLRMFRQDDPQHRLVRAALDELAREWDGPLAYPVVVGVAAAGHGIARIENEVGD